MLSELLPLEPGMVVALVGAGGKTTTMFRLAAEQVARGARVITTTTTHIFPPGPGQTGALVLSPEHETLLERAAAALARQPHITVATSAGSQDAAENVGTGFPQGPLPAGEGKRSEPQTVPRSGPQTPAAGEMPDGKLHGVPPEWVADLVALPGVSFVLVEADGAKGRMLKAPATHEPALPPGANLVLLLASAEALGQPLSEVTTHRPEQIAAVTGLKLGETLTPQALARLATHQEGLLKGVPSGVPAILVLTHVSQARLASAEIVAQHTLASSHLAGVVLCSLEWATFKPSGNVQRHRL